MEIEFTAKTNKDYCMVNKAYFETVDGQTVGIDRLDTDYAVSDDGILTMEWSGGYLWEIDGINPFNSEEESMTIYNDRMLKTLLTGAKFKYLELEDDADDDYEVTDIKVRLDIPVPKFEVKTRGGILTAEASFDPKNPGINVCYAPDGADGTIDLVYVENTDLNCRVYERNPDPNDIRIMLYEDPYQEDYTREMVFRNAAIRDAMDL